MSKELRVPDEGRISLVRGGYSRFFDRTGPHHLSTVASAARLASWGQISHQELGMHYEYNEVRIILLCSIQIFSCDIIEMADLIATSPTPPPNTPPL